MNGIIATKNANSAETDTASLMATLGIELCRVSSEDGSTSLNTNMTSMLSRFKQTRERIGPANISTNHLALHHKIKVKNSRPLAKSTRMSSCSRQSRWINSWSNTSLVS